MDERSLTFYLAHSAATGNIGDDAMLLNAARRLREWFPGCRLRVPLRSGGTLPEGLPPHEVVPDVREWIALALRATKPFRLGHRWPDPTREDGGPAVAWRRRASDWLASVISTAGAAGLASLRALETSDVLYVTGDNAINDFNPSGVFERLCLLRVARRFGLGIVLSSQGIGPMTSPWGQDALEGMLAVADLVSYRYDGDGTALSRSLAPTRVWQATTGDEAFSLPNADETAAATRVLERAGVRPGDRYIAIHFRDADFTPDHLDVTPAIAHVLDEVATRVPDPFVFFPMSVSSRYGLDAEFGERIRGLMSAPTRVRIAEDAGRAAVVKAAVARARLTLGSSYHLHVFGLSQHVPAVIAYTGAYYASKSFGLAALYPPTRALDMKTADPMEVVTAVETALADEDRSALHAANARLSSVNDALLRELSQRLVDGTLGRVNSAIDADSRADSRIAR